MRYETMVRRQFVGWFAEARVGSDAHPMFDHVLRDSVQAPCGRVRVETAGARLTNAAPHGTWPCEPCLAALADIQQAMEG